MILGEKSVRQYKMNRDTTITVKSEMKAQGVYTHTVVVQKELITNQPLKFAGKDALAELVKGFDLETDQTVLIEA